MKKCLGVFMTVAILLVATSFVGVVGPNEESEDKYIRSINFDNMMNANWTFEEYDEYFVDFHENTLQFGGILFNNASEIFNCVELEMLSMQHDDIVRVENTIEITESVLRITISYYLGDELLGSGSIYGLPLFGEGKADAVFKIDGVNVYLSDLAQQTVVENCFFFFIPVIKVVITVSTKTVVVAAAATTVAVAAILLADYYYDSLVDLAVNLNKAARTVTILGVTYVLTQLHNNMDRPEPGKFYFATLISGSVWVNFEEALPKDAARTIVEMNDPDKNVYTLLEIDARLLAIKSGGLATLQGVGDLHIKNDSPVGSVYYPHHHAILDGGVRGLVHIWFGGPFIKT
ncbi:MAG: hypothetical protein FWD92_02920 [Methanomassiliicoccaceae archaeon]|nr:hypothetical protein [Methanomassiliicoccaceae archaeon]